MKIKTFNRMLLLAVLTLTTWGCGGGGHDEPEPTPTPPSPAVTGKCYDKTVDLTARATATTVSLTGLSAGVTRSSGSASWLNTELLPYMSGTPQVMLMVEENSQMASRQQELTFYAANDTLVLTVRQSAFNSDGGTDMDNPFDTPSDEPGYSRRQ